jgi:hypothetical protein
MNAPDRYDPTADLSEIHHVIGQLRSRLDGATNTPTTPAQYRDVASVLALSERLADLVEALDGWISGGGFLPAAWERGRPPVLEPGSLQAWPVVHIDTKPGGAVFVRLPKELQRPIPGGLCACKYCTSHPDEPPTWDTLGIPTDGDSRGTWTVHAPEWKAVGR